MNDTRKVLEPSETALYWKRHALDAENSVWDRIMYWESAYNCVVNQLADLDRLGSGAGEDFAPARGADTAAELLATTPPAAVDTGEAVVVCCEDCDRTYGDEHGFPDLIITFDAWQQISTTKDEGGLLCPSCICARLHKAGITCEGAFMSGPVESVPRSVMWSLRMVENILRREQKREDEEAAALRDHDRSQGR